MNFPTKLLDVVRKHLCAFEAFKKAFVNIVQWGKRVFHSCIERSTRKDPTIYMCIVYQYTILYYTRLLYYTIPGSTKRSLSLYLKFRRYFIPTPVLVI